MFCFAPGRGEKAELAFRVFFVICTSLYDFSHMIYVYADIGIELPIKKSH